MDQIAEQQKVREALMEKTKANEIRLKELRIKKEQDQQMKRDENHRKLLKRQ